MERIPAPKPGIYSGVPFETYCSWDALNHSKLKRLIEGCSLRSFKRGLSDEDSPAKIFGRAAHMAFLEPDKFAASFALAPINEKTQKAYGYDTKTYQEACAAQPDKVLLSAEDIDGCKLLVQNIREHTIARQVFEEAGMAEVCLVWVCPITGMTCKGRIDYLNNFATDLKSTACAAPSALSSDIVNFFYHTQAAFYELGKQAMPKPIDAPHTLVFLEKKTWDVAVHEIDEPTMAIARTLVTEALQKVARCREEKHYPGYTEKGIESIGAPLWYLKRFEDAEV